MNSFYGGPAGQSFEIKRVFSSYTELKADAEKGWKSSVGVGEYVMISYGDPSTDAYISARNIDLSNESLSKEERKNWNSTLWQKEYDEAKTMSDTGMSYKYITSCAGYTPRINAEVIETLAPGSEADADIRKDDGYPDNVTIELKIPGGWDFKPGIQEIIPVNVDVLPSVKLENVGTAGTGEYAHKAYYGAFTFSLPQAQKLAGVEYEELPVNEKPYGYLITAGEHTVFVDSSSVQKTVTATVNAPVLHLGLPINQVFESDEDHVIKIDLNANELPTVSLGYAPEDVLKQYPILTFGLPKAWNILVNPEIQKQDNPLGTPTISVNEDASKSEKTWTLSLPRNVEFHVVDIINEETAIKGDYYFLTTDGSLYGYINKKWTKLICFVPPMSNEVQLTTISPYKENGSPADPTAAISQNTQGKWEFSFGLPKAPEVAAGYQFVGSTETGTVTSKVTDIDTVTFDFKIPTGSKLFAGLEITEDGSTVTIAGARPGDLYLNSSTGKVYILETDGWKAKEDTLKGPIGDALNIVASYEIKEEDGYPNTITTIGNYIDTHYSGTINNQDIFAISYVEEDSGTETAYWYFKIDETWSCVQLTGGVANLIENTYNDKAGGAVVNKTYSINYINTLIEGTDSETGKLTTYSKAKIDELLSALDDTLNTWGTFKDLP